MAFCQNCGAPYEGSPAFCENCGSPLARAQSPASAEPNYWQAETPNQQSSPYASPGPDPSAQSYYTPGQSSYQSQTSYQAQAFRQAVEPYAAGGLIAWAIVTLLLCTIPGIVALVNATQINKAVSVEDQQKKIKSTKIWCTVGTILGVFALIGTIATRNQ